MGHGQSTEEEDGALALPFSDTIPLQDPATGDKHSRLLDLPSELLDQILEYLSPVALASICQTCHRFNRHGNAERLWKAHLVGCPPYEINSYQPYKSWKELYSIYFPYWFLVQRQIWFSDGSSRWNEPKGNFMLTKWDAIAGEIQLLYLQVSNAAVGLSLVGWTHDPTVFYSRFIPSLTLVQRFALHQDSMNCGSNRLRQEAVLARHSLVYNLYIFPAISILPERQAASMALWPPSCLPAPERTRKDSPSTFRDPSHKPASYDQMCSTIFRLRQCRALGQLDEDDGLVETYSSVLPEYLEPTTEKPYQGLWVGDYSSHGCEIILIIQRLPGEERHIPMPSEISTWRDTYSYRPEFIDPHLPPASAPEPIGCSGSLYAIKLTGDRNVPRGELSWIAPDIGRGGLVRVAQEPEFQGSRVVSSAGHVAQDRFTRDRYTPCHLIMISENLLAQHWLEMSHISFFERVNIDALLQTAH